MKVSTRGGTRFSTRVSPRHAAATTSKPYSSLSRRYRDTLISIAALLLTVPAHAALLLTEIHYNGAASGTDPDEFIELSNSGSHSLDLFGYTFAAGIDYVFSATTNLGNSQSLILARDVGDFAIAFPDYLGVLLDFSGALSNSGETLTLNNSVGDTVWSMSYDDAGVWPVSADGGGDSLQLKPGGVALDSASNWLAASPTPGRWDGFADDSGSASVSVPQPSSALLLLTALPIAWGCRRRTRAAQAQRKALHSRRW